MSTDTDYAKCVEIVDCLAILRDDLFKGIPVVDKLSADLESDFGNLHGGCRSGCQSSGGTDVVQVSCHSWPAIAY